MMAAARVIEINMKQVLNLLNSFIKWRFAP